VVQIRLLSPCINKACHRGAGGKYIKAGFSFKNKTTKAISILNEASRVISNKGTAVAALIFPLPPLLPQVVLNNHVFRALLSFFSNCLLGPLQVCLPKAQNYFVV